MNARNILRCLHSTDLVIIAFFALLIMLNILFAGRITGWWIMVLINLVIITGVGMLAVAHASSRLKILAYVHDWYVAPLVFFTFKELYFMIKPIHQGNDYDDWLIAADRWIFGVDPTHWLMQFSHPAITEVLQIAYTSFYFLFLLIGYELYRKHSPGAFHFFMFTCVYGFYLSYLGYFTLPAVGPRFTLHDFNSLDSELPGLWLTPYLRCIVNAGESVPMGVSSAEAMAGAQRDVFPSGHTMMTLVLMVLSKRYRLKSRHFVWVTGVLLIVATVYQRYHYVVDLVAGAVFAIICMYTASRLYRYLCLKVETMDCRYPWSPGDR
jgi:membrane-associated phospholipid phosphatase